MLCRTSQIRLLVFVTTADRHLWELHHDSHKPSGPAGCHPCADCPCTGRRLILAPDVGSSLQQKRVRSWSDSSQQKKVIFSLASLIMRSKIHYNVINEMKYCPSSVSLINRLRIKKSPNTFECTDLTRFRNVINLVGWDHIDHGVLFLVSRNR